jgi:AbrB family looped-hinge helix DNA binding protein
MRVTAKGQVTIPQDIRLRLGLQPETEVEFDVVGNTVRIRKRSGRPGRGRGIVDRLRGRATTRLSTDQILALTRG